MSDELSLPSPSILNDATWARVREVLPPAGRIGRPRANDRLVLAAVLWVLRSGRSWAKLPRRYGHHVTAWRRYRRWREDGTWTEVLALLRSIEAEAAREPAAPRRRLLTRDPASWSGLDALVDSSPEWGSLDIADGLGA